jgi:hypothetical protein
MRPSRSRSIPEEKADFLPLNPKVMDPWPPTDFEPLSLADRLRSLLGPRMTKRSAGNGPAGRRFGSLWGASAVRRQKLGRVLTRKRRRERPAGVFRSGLIS